MPNRAVPAICVEWVLIQLPTARTLPFYGVVFSLANRLASPYYMYRVLANISGQRLDWP